MPKFILTIPVHVVPLEPKSHYWTKDTQVSFTVEAPDSGPALEALGEVLQQLTDLQAADNVKKQQVILTAQAAAKAKKAAAKQAVVENYKMRHPAKE